MVLQDFHSSFYDTHQRWRSVTEKLMSQSRRHEAKLCSGGWPHALCFPQCGNHAKQGHLARMVSLHSCVCWGSANFLILCGLALRPLAGGVGAGLLC